MSIQDLTWSKKEKAISRKAFNNALNKEMAVVKNEIKNRANKLITNDQIWDLHDYLSDVRKNIAYKYDYRYSKLIIVFGRLLAEGYLTEEDLNGLSEEKMSFIKKVAGLD